MNLYALPVLFFVFSSAFSASKFKNSNRGKINADDSKKSSGEKKSSGRKSSGREKSDVGAGTLTNTGGTSGASRAGGALGSFTTWTTRTTTLTIVFTSRLYNRVLSRRVRLISSSVSLRRASNVIYTCRPYTRMIIFKLNDHYVLD